MFNAKKPSKQKEVPSTLRELDTSEISIISGGDGAPSPPPPPPPPPTSKIGPKQKAWL